MQHPPALRNSAGAGTGAGTDSSQRVGATPAVYAQPNGAAASAAAAAAAGHAASPNASATHTHTHHTQSVSSISTLSQSGHSAPNMSSGLASSSASAPGQQPTSSASSAAGSWGRSSTAPRPVSGMNGSGAGAGAGAGAGSGLSADEPSPALSTSGASGSGSLRGRRSSTPHTPPSPRKSSRPVSGAALPSPSHCQAIYSFDSSSMPSSSALAHNMYLSFNQGEVIRVHGRDRSGWWDGEIPERDGVHSRRGWFPSNYVRELDREEVREMYRASERDPPSPNASYDRRAEARSRHTSVMSHASHASHASQHSVHSQLSYASHYSGQSRATDGGGGGGGGGGHSSSLSQPLSPALQTLLQPILQSLSLLQSSIHSHRRAHIQPSAAQVISAIRAALLRMDCLSKESRTLAAHPILAKERRYVLAELSKLVACAKLAGTEVDESDDDAALVATGKAARSVFASVRRFLLHASEAGVSVQPLETDGTEPPGSANDLTTATGMPQSRMRVKVPSGSGSRGPDAYRMKSASVSDLRGTARRQGGGPAPPLPTSSGSANSITGQSVSAVSVKSPSVGSSGSGRSSPVSFRSRRRASSHARHAHGPSFEQIAQQQTESPELLQTEFSQSTSAVPQRAAETYPDPPIKQYPSGEAVHEAVGTAEDALLSIIASFIGHIHSHHIDSHPSSHAYLIELTRETVDRVRDLLTIVEGVGRQAGALGVRQRELESLKAARDELYDAASQLVEGAEAVANAPFSEGGEDAYDAEKTGLLRVTTTTLRAGTECARVVCQCVSEDAGHPDYDLPQSAGSGTNRGYAGIGLGIRGPQSLQSLARRATSLGQLHRRYQQDGGARVSVPPPKRPVDNDDEEIVADQASEDEGDVTMRVSPLRDDEGSRPTSHPPPATPSKDGASDPTTRRLSDATLLSVRSRTTSLSSPTTKKIAHKSPSRSVDLGKYMSVDRELSRPSTLGSLGSQSRFSTSQRNSASSLAPPMPEQANGDQAEKDIKRSSSVSTAPTRPPPAPPAGEDGDPSRFWAVKHDFDLNETAYNSEGTLVGGTLRVLVEKMTPHDGTPDLNFSSAFWYTFRLFTTPEELVRTLIARYEMPVPPVVEGMDEQQLQAWKSSKQIPVRIRVSNFIKQWLESYWRPDSDDQVLDTLEAFARDTLSTTLPGGMGPRILDAVKKRREHVATSVTGSESTVVATTPKSANFDRTRTLTGMLHTPAAPSALPTPIISKALHQQLQRPGAPSSIAITDFDTLELARQLTIMESKLFAAVAPEDLLMTGKKSVPELKALSTLSNQITGWVTDVILNEQDAKHRAALLKFFIKLADKCLLLNNYSSLFAVLAGLNSSTILRLKKTWDVLSVKYRVLMDRLRGVIEHTKNHAAYRTRLRETAGPCLPFLGLILSDITFTQDGNPNTRTTTLNPELQLINQDKYTKLGRIASDFRRYQTPFDLKELDPVQLFLQRVLAERGSGSLDALYRKSLLLEPRQGSEKLNNAVERPGWLGAGLAQRLQV